MKKSGKLQAFIDNINAKLKQSKKMSAKEYEEKYPSTFEEYCHAVEVTRLGQQQSTKFIGKPNSNTFKHLNPTKPLKMPNYDYITAAGIVDEGRRLRSPKRKVN